MKKLDYNYWLQQAASWAANYRNTIRTRKIRPNINFGDVLKQLPNSAPEKSEPMEKIFADFEKIIPDNMTHWQHPRFFAYFQANASTAAQIGDALANAMAAQCMLWQTSPAATELEIKMVSWLQQSFGLPNTFRGSFQDTASMVTLAAILTMRERALDFNGNKQGLFNKKILRIYASEHNHSSIEKAMWIAGLGSENLVTINGGGENYSLDINELKNKIKQDKQNGLVPAGIIACVGATSIGAIDDVNAICNISAAENLYVHVDAAWAGAAMICREYRQLWHGIERADSIVINPHKWLGVPLECSLHLVRDEKMLQKTLAIKPAYLKNTNESEVVNFSEWSLSLGRRFRSLKVWFLLRSEGLENLRARIRNHINWSQELAKKLAAEKDFEIVTQPIFSLFTFRHLVDGDVNKHNLELVEKINNDGRIYLTQTTFRDKVVIRFVAGQFDMQQHDVDIAFEVIREIADHSLFREKL